jgi:hypothetical protein
MFFFQSTGGVLLRHFAVVFVQIPLAMELGSEHQVVLYKSTFVLVHSLYFYDDEYFSLREEGVDICLTFSTATNYV